MKNKNLIRNVFEESKKTKLLLSIYQDCNDINKFFVGYVLEIFQDSILIDIFDEYGKNDGYLLLRLMDIIKVEKDSIYLNNLNKFIFIENAKLDTLTAKGQNGIVDIISLCRKNNILLTIELIYDDFIIGFVSDEDDDYYQIETYSKDGLYQGKTFIKYTDIQRLHFLGNEEKNLLTLINNQVT
jgi:hypothetical protein